MDLCLRCRGNSLEGRHPKRKEKHLDAIVKQPKGMKERGTRIRLAQDTFIPRFVIKVAQDLQSNIQTLLGGCQCM